ncbi:MAG TPA: diacylglycerol kinase family protein [Crocinitomicaceae bacterium]|nr:diacylglycerol kinase family protein [Crocinitomicaceae bacterium]
MKQKISFSKQLKSFHFAFNGLRILFREEHNSWIHLFLTFFAIVFGFLLKISVLEWVLLIFSIGFVFVSEIFNSAIENICDLISLENNPLIGKIKDLSAAAVLFSAITAFIIGTVIFLPKIVVLF